MKGNRIKEAGGCLAMLILVCFGYAQFYNKAFSGYEAQGANIWLSASTVKFVNNWLKEGPLNLKFIMYELPDSVEFKNLAEREAYISYPPGSIVPPYILARLLNKSEIQVGFIKQFLTMKFLLDTLLVCLIAYSIFRIVFRLPRSNMAIFTSIISALSWMCLPINLYFLRNVYFSDQGVITVVLIYIMLEIWGERFTKTPSVKFIYLGFKFLVSLCGVLTDYYFLFLLFVSWLVRIVPLVKSKENLKKIFLASLIYVMPVLLGLGLFYLQISQVSNYENRILDIMVFRISGDLAGEKNKIYIIILEMLHRYHVGWLLTGFMAVSAFVKKKFLQRKYRPLLDIMAIIYIPPFLQVFVLQNHSAIHVFSMLKFALPVMLGFIISPFLVFALKTAPDAGVVVRPENDDDFLISKSRSIYLIIILASVGFCGISNMTKYCQKMIGAPKTYERENLIRSNYGYFDVYFSFTESIEASPPEHLAISKKLIHKIDSIPAIFEKFPDLSPEARVLLVVNKNDEAKPARVIENEQKTLKAAHLLFSSENYEVYRIDRPTEHRRQP